MTANAGKCDAGRCGFSGRGGPCDGPRRGQSRLKSERLPRSGRGMGRAGKPRVRALRFRRNRPEPPEPTRRRIGRNSGAHPRDRMALPSPGRVGPFAGPLAPARRIRPAAASSTRAKQLGVPRRIRLSSLQTPVEADQTACMVSAKVAALGKDSVKVSAPGALRELPGGSGGGEAESVPS